jgi:predicted nuclease of predicted toxin-antitoxin system
MRLLIDANLSTRVAARLAEAGYDVEHVKDQGMGAASDPVILEYATSHGQTIVSADADFTTMLAIGGLVAPSLVLLRSTDNLTPDGQAALLVSNLPTVTTYLEVGAVVSLSSVHLRVRDLPIT